MRLIDGDVLIEFIENRYDITWENDYEGGIKDACVDILEEICKMPTIEPRPRWIPVTERLPEDDTEVIVSCTDDSGDSEFSYTTTGWHFKGLWVVDNERSCFVRAWIPLPEAWKGVERRC